MNYTSGKRYVKHKVFNDLRALLKDCCKRYGKNDAYIFRKVAKGESIHKTYNEFWDDIQALGSGVLAKGLVNLPKSAERQPLGSPDKKPKNYGQAGSCCTLDKQRARIAVIGENSYQWILMHNATLFGLGISVPLDKQLSPKEIGILVKRANLDILAFDAGMYEIIQQIMPELSHIKHFIVMNDRELAGKLQLEDSRYEDLQSLIELGKQALANKNLHFQKLALDPDMPASLIFTSGTSANSKGVLLSHRNIAMNASQAARLLDLPSGYRTLSLLPLHHTFENTCGMYGLWNYGITVCINDNLRYIAYNLKDWQIQIVLCVPAIVEALYKQIQRTIKKQKKQRQVELARLACNGMLKLGIDNRRSIFKQIHDQLGNLRYMIVGAAALDPTISTFFNDIGIELWTGYGLTEAAPLISANNQVLNMISSVGQVCPDLELKIVSETAEGNYDNTDDGSGLNKFNFFKFFQPQTEPQKGEICVKGPNVMLGYFENEAETANAIDAEGWLHTGDVGYLNDRGCLYITGRIKSMIVMTNGKKVFPEEIEVLLTQIPGVQNALCWGEENSREQVDVVAKLQIQADNLPATCKTADGKIDEQATEVFLTEQIAKINTHLPIYKLIRHFVWTTEPLTMTTTLKIKRPLEIAKTRNFLAEYNLTMKEAQGKNLVSIAEKAAQLSVEDAKVSATAEEKED